MPAILRLQAEHIMASMQDFEPSTSAPVAICRDLTLAHAAGYRITCCAATEDQSAFILSIPRRPPVDEVQETLRTSSFPCHHVKVRAACKTSSLVLK